MDAVKHLTLAPNRLGLALKEGGELQLYRALLARDAEVVAGQPLQFVCPTQPKLAAALHNPERRRPWAIHTVDTDVAFRSLHLCWSRASLRMLSPSHA